MKDPLYNTKMMIKEHNQFLFRVSSVHSFKNKLTQLYIASKKTNIKEGSKYFKRLEHYKNDEDIKAFYDYCAFNEIQPFRFLNRGKDAKKYILVHKHKYTDYRNHVVNIDEMYGTSKKYIFDEYVKRNLINDGHEVKFPYVYNIKIDENTIYYTAHKNIELVNVDANKHLLDKTDKYSITPSSVYTAKTRENFSRFVDYITTRTDLFSNNLSFIRLADKQQIVIIGEGSNTVINDFIWFEENNTLPCKVCNMLVPNAFSGYGIQFDSHDGCR